MANLSLDGVPADKIVLADNTVVEATVGMLPGEAAARERSRSAWARVRGVGTGATIHRPENTEDPQRLRTILDELSKLGVRVLLPVVISASPTVGATLRDLDESFGSVP